MIKEQSPKKNQSIFYKCLNSDNDMGRKIGYSFKALFSDLSEWTKSFTNEHTYVCTGVGTHIGPQTFF